MRAPFEPLAPGAAMYRTPTPTAGRRTRSALGGRGVEERIEFEGAETVAAVILEPVQNGGGCFVPQEGYFQRVREICDRHKVLFISDEVICSGGRLGQCFGCDRYGYVPDIITTAKGLTSAYIPMGAMIASERLAAPFLEERASFAHGSRSAGIPSPRPLRSRTSSCSSATTCAGTCVARRASSAPCSRVARHPDRRRRARRRLLPRDRARQGQGD